MISIQSYVTGMTKMYEFLSLENAAAATTQ